MSAVSNGNDRGSGYHSPKEQAKVNDVFLLQAGIMTEKEFADKWCTKAKTELSEGSTSTAALPSKPVIKPVPGFPPHLWHLNQDKLLNRISEPTQKETCTTPQSVVSVDIHFNKTAISQAQNGSLQTPEVTKSSRQDELPSSANKQGQNNALSYSHGSGGHQSPPDTKATHLDKWSSSANRVSKAKLGDIQKSQATQTDCRDKLSSSSPSCELGVNQAPQVKKNIDHDNLVISITRVGDAKASSISRVSPKAADILPGQALRERHSAMQKNENIDPSTSQTMANKKQLFSWVDQLQEQRDRRPGEDWNVSKVAPAGKENIAPQKAQSPSLPGLEKSQPLIEKQTQPTFAEVCKGAAPVVAKVSVGQSRLVAKSKIPAGLLTSRHSPLMQRQPVLKASMEALRVVKATHERKMPQALSTFTTAVSQHEIYHQAGVSPSDTFFRAGLGRKLDDGRTDRASYAGPVPPLGGSFVGWKPTVEVTRTTDHIERDEVLACLDTKLETQDLVDDRVSQGGWESSEDDFSPNRSDLHRQICTWLLTFEDPLPEVCFDDLEGHWQCDIDTETGRFIEPADHPETMVDPNDVDPRSRASVGLDFRRQNQNSSLMALKSQGGLVKMTEALFASLTNEPSPPPTPVKSKPCVVPMTTSQRPVAPKPPKEPFAPGIFCYLRKARDDDIPGIMDIYNNEVVRGSQAVDVQPLTFEDCRDLLWDTHANEMPFVVAIESAPNTEIEKLVGFAAMMPWSQGIAGSWHRSTKTTGLLQLFVRADYRQKNVGSCLMDRILCLSTPNYRQQYKYRVLPQGGRKAPLSELKHDIPKSVFTKIYINYYLKCPGQNVGSDTVQHFDESEGDQDLKWLVPHLKDKFSFELLPTRFLRVMHSIERARRPPAWYDMVMFECCCVAKQQPNNKTVCDAKQRPSNKNGKERR